MTLGLLFRLLNVQIDGVDKPDSSLCKLGAGDAVLLAGTKDCVDCDRLAAAATADDTDAAGDSSGAAGLPALSVEAEYASAVDVSAKL